MKLKHTVYRVLIAEADEAVRRQLTQALGDVYDVREATDGRTALQILHDPGDPPDAVITDLDLEGTTGLHVMVAAHSIDPNLPVLVVTKPQRLDRALEALRLGARDCIVMPLDSVELLRYAIERALEDRALPEEKQRLHRELRNATRIKERLLRLVSEDFHQMLDEFNDYCRALDDEAEETPRLLSRARSTARWMNLRTEQVSVFAEIENYAPKMHPARLGLTEWIDLAASKIPLDPKTHKIEVVQPMPRVTADPVRLVQIFENLLCNAVQYSPKGGTIRVEAREGDEFVDCVVLDAGRPIPIDLLPLVCEPFARQGRPKIPGVHSTGLGLSIARSLIELQGGKLRIENTPSGVAFRFTLLPARD